jgi:hypothetical protein
MMTKQTYRVTLRFACGHETKPLTTLPPDSQDVILRDASSRPCSWCEAGEPFPTPDRLAWITDQSDKCFA